MAKDLLIELGTEELPPKSLKALSNAFSKGIVNGLEQANLNFGEVRSFASPRRLAIFIKALDEQQADTSSQKLGPAVAAAFDADGNPTKAAQGFARGLGLTVDQLDHVDSPKGPRLGFVVHTAGASTESLIGAIVDESLSKLPIAKRMRWGAKRAEFVRPAHWLVALWGDDVLPLNVLDLCADRISRGHRVHGSDAIKIDSPASYEQQLLDNKVIAHYGDRQDKISAEVKSVATSLGGNAVIDDALLDEVTGLVEWPIGLGGSFDQEFLTVPSESLVSSMKEHQKYFHLVDNKGALMPNFITLSNIESTNPQAVIEGNERVIRPRLADAKFFYDTDLKQSLKGNVDRLKKIVFQAKLGTVYDKTQRIAKLAGFIADAIDGSSSKAQDAAQVCKSDLVSEMVTEFPDLQGIMGRYYATAEGYDADVAEALEQHYWPAFAGDALPNSTTSIALALADRLDTLCGIFAIEQFPTGSKDPFALRRASLGILRILIEKALPFDLNTLVAKALEGFDGVLEVPSATHSKVIEYVIERLRAWSQDQGYSTETFIAVAETGCTAPLDFSNRLAAVSQFAKSDAASSLANNNKRVKNILEKADTDIGDVTASLFVESAEAALYDAINASSSELSKAKADGDYEHALTVLSALEAPISSFFDDVMVNADDAALKANRLALLKLVRAQFVDIAAIEALAI